MTLNWKTLTASGMFALSAQVAYADCGIESGNVSLLSNDFGAMHAMADFIDNCASDTVKITLNQTTEVDEIRIAALSANPAQYSIVIANNGTISSMLTEDLIRPLDDMIAKYGQNIKPNQLIKIDGKVMAIATMANAQHLYYRKDILENAGLAVPTSYEDILTVGKALQDGGMATPFVTNFKTGWDLGEEFVNMYMGYGGELFKDGSAMANVNSEAGLKTLNMLKSLSELAGPDFLTYDSNATSERWEAGTTAMAQMWGSRATSLLDDEGSTPEVVNNTVLASAATVGGGSRPASTLFWDGFTIAKNISDEDAEASFKAIMNVMTPEFIETHNDAAVWLIDGYTPAATSKGVTATASGGAVSYPSPPFMGLLHMALGNEITDFLQGQESAEQALKDVEAAYTTAAREQGFLN